MPKILGYKMSANHIGWKRQLNLNSKPREQENTYTRMRMDRSLNDNANHNFTGFNRRFENWSDGDGYREANPILSNLEVCKDFIKVFNHTEGYARKQCEKLFNEYLDTLEVFNICPNCKEAIKTKKHRISGAIKKADENFQSDDLTLPKGWDIGKQKQESIVVNTSEKCDADYINATGVSRVKTMTVAYRDINGKLIKESVEKQSITYRKSIKNGVTTTTALIPEHYELRLFVMVDGVKYELPFTRKNFLANLMNKKARCGYVKVESQHIFTDKCNCFLSDERKG